MRGIIISLVAISLLAPSVVEAHHANPWVAGLMTPITYGISFVILTARNSPDPPITASLFTVPGFGYIYAGEPSRGVFIIGCWALGAYAFTAEMGGPDIGLPLVGFAVMLTTIIFDIFGAPKAAKRHNEKHAKEKSGSRSLSIFPVFAVSLKDDGMKAGVAIWF